LALRRRQSAGYLANHMARLFAIQLAKRLQRLGLAPAQFAVLLVLWENDALTQKELVELLDLEQATVVNTLNRMERDGLIVRKRHPRDGRSQIICITPKARGLEAPATRLAIVVNAQALAGLTDAARETLLDLMRRVVEKQRAGRKRLPRM
jgi:DNA-binding MarR family transcriptional regulator